MRKISLIGGLILMALSACGGGGANSGSSGESGAGTTVPTSNGAVRFTPGRIDIEITEGQDPEISVLAEATKDLPGKVNVAISGTSGVFSPALTVRAWTARSYSAYLHLASGLKPGTYNGSLNVQLCQDDATICAQPHATGPLTIPYRVVVNAFASNLTALRADPAAAEWQMDRGGFTRAGYVNTTVDVARLAPRFSWAAPDDGKSGVPAIHDGVAYVTTRGNLYAIDEQTGATKWAHPAGDTQYTTEWTRPAVADGKVYASINWSGASTLQIIDIATRKRIAELPTSQASILTAPTIDGNLVYTKQNGGSFEAIDLSGHRYLIRLGSSSQWAVAAPPVLLGSAMYAYTGGGLHAIDRTNPELIRRIEGSRPQLDFGFDAMALDANHIAVIENDGYGHLESATLTSFDLAAGKVSWSIKGGYERIAARGTTIYAARNGRVFAMDGTTGTELWSWVVPVDVKPQADHPLVAALLVTNNVLFVSTAHTVHAIDLAQRTAVWSANVGGNMALSRNGVLYLADGKSPLRAFNVR